MSFLRYLLRFLPTQTRRRSDRRLKTTRSQHAQFASFLEDSGFRRHHADHYEHAMKRRRVVKNFLKLATSVGAIWVVIESAKALTLF
ncbi:hypothetical protein [Oleiharenicola lentus]|uniref:hypothetical protein n=1 Tax=Oleiharenicola lentus TaxID=2508720 RepID=UPI003F66E306